MQEHKQARPLARTECQPSFFVTRTIVMSVLAVGSMVLLLAGRADAQRALLTRNSSAFSQLQAGKTTILAGFRSSGIVNAVVYDVTHRRYYTYGAPTQFLTASAMKVPIMLTFLDMTERQGRGPSSYELALLRTMIENSNNDSASALYYGEIGGAAGVRRFLQRIGMTGLYPNPYAWGWSLITPLTMVNLLRRLYEGTILTASDRWLALSLLENVEADQRVGVGDTVSGRARVALKSGWVPGPDGLWAVNSSGIVMAGYETYIIAVYTKAQPSLGAGQIVVRQACSRVASQLL